MCSLYLICYLLASLAPKVSTSNLGIGLRLDTSSWGYKNALQVLKSQGVQYIKTWSINSSWLHHVENMFGKVFALHVFMRLLLFRLLNVILFVYFLFLVICLFFISRNLIGCKKHLKIYQ